MYLCLVAKISWKLIFFVQKSRGQPSCSRSFDVTKSVLVRLLLETRDYFITWWIYFLQDNSKFK